MKFLLHTLPFILCLLFNQINSAQISFDVTPQHVGFSDNFTGGEFTHWQATDLSFFVADLGRESSFTGSSLSFSNLTSNSYLEDGILSFRAQGGMITPEDKMRLTKSDLTFVNGASFDAIKAWQSANAGILHLNSANGKRNVALSYANGSDRGYVYVGDGMGNPQAGMYINELNQGIVFADMKNFRVKHPEKSQKEIWYASLEGPEVAAYDRGTAKLVDGKTFVAFQDHFKHIANTSNMTVHVTPHSSDTYGLAVIEKRKDGFYVKELKGGNGNFSFDWEVKCVRIGKEKFQVVRDVDPGLSPALDLIEGNESINNKSQIIKPIDMQKHMKAIYKN